MGFPEGVLLRSFTSPQREGWRGLAMAGNPHKAATRPQDSGRGETYQTSLKYSHDTS